MNRHDILCKSLNPTLLFVSKNTRLETGHSHCHDYIELTYILSGTGQYQINDRLFQAQAGDLLFINPGDAHTTIITDRSKPLTLFAIGFTDIDIKGLNMPENAFLFPGVPAVYHCPDQLRAQLSLLIEQMLTEKSRQLPGKYFYLHAYLVQTLLIIIRHFYKPEENAATLPDKEYSLSHFDRKQMVRDICDYMKEHYADKISLDGIAKNIYLSPIYLSRLFKEETGDSPINYLISIRMKKAAQLLKNSRLSIKETAALVGYDNAYYFSKLFKKHYQLSPKEYRDRLT